MRERSKSDLLLVGHVNYAIFKAAAENADRDWRRRKREIRKAVRTASKAYRGFVPLQTPLYGLLQAGAGI